MARTRFIDHGGKRILLLDYTGLGASMDALAREIEESKRVIAAEPPGSVLALTDVRGARISTAAVRAMQELVKFNTPYVRWSAIVVGLTGVYLTAFRATQVLSRRRNLRAFNDPDEAREWLVAQP